MRNTLMVFIAMGFMFGNTVSAEPKAAPQTDPDMITEQELDELGYELNEELEQYLRHTNDAHKNRVVSLLRERA